MLPTPVLWPGELHRLYSPWGHKESDTTEPLSLSLNSMLDTVLGSGDTIMSKYRCRVYFLGFVIQSGR